MKKWLCLLWLALTFNEHVYAEDVAIPAPLEAWQQWVLKDHEFRRCPLSYGQAGADAEHFICTWYGALHLDVNQRGARFELPVEVFRDGVVALPGDESNWPHHVSQHGKPIAVTARDGIPHVFLSRGHHVISGEFSWPQRPAQLSLPSPLALVNLTVDGAPVNFIRRDAATLSLGASTEKHSEQDSLDVQVYRLIQDGIPLLSETRIHLNVTGRAREIVLGKALLDGFSAMDLQSELASKLDNNGVMTVQALPGEWDIVLRARANVLPSQLQRNAVTAPWPQDEIWSFANNEALRAVSFDGGIAVDPQQVDVPPQWSSFAAQRVSDSTTITLTERARGTQDTRNHLNWQRDLWLRFNGDRFAFVDHISGSMQDGWRLNVQKGVQLLNADVNGVAQPITQIAANDDIGVELRDQNVNLRSSGELDRHAAMAASGWQTDFDQASLRLHLPPGYQLFSATGVDSADGSFLSQWNLLDGFLLALTTAIVFRLLGWLWAVIAAFTLASLFHLNSMPYWLLLNAVATVLITRYADGKLSLWLTRYRHLSLAILVLASLPFMSAQVRSLLHPQLEAVPYQTRFDGGISAQNADIAPAMMSAPASEMAETMLTKNKDTSKERRARSYERYGQTSINQAGNGIPNWQWKSYALNWQGPLNAEQSLSLYIVSRPLNALWQGSALIGFMVLLVMILRAAGGILPWQYFSQRAIASVIVLCSLSALSPRADAAIPTPELLNELRTRLTAAPDCAPNCVDVSDAQITVEQNRLTITMTVHALFDSALPLPGRRDEWMANTVLRDGQAAALHQLNEQWQLALSKGVHRVQLSGLLPLRNRISVQFPAMPRYVVVNAKGWEVMGLEGNRLPSGALDLLRSSVTTQSTKVAENQVTITPFVRVHRHLYLGLDWSSETVVERLAPTQAAFSIMIPLAPDETLTSTALRVQEGNVVLNFAAGEARKSYSANVKRSSALRWQDTRADLVAEWSIYPSAMWRVDYVGSPLVLRDDDPSVLHFVPRTDEQLQLTIARPDVVSGNTIAYDDVTLNENVGQRQRNGQLNLTYRATQGGEQRLQLSPDMTVTGVQSDGVALVQRPQNGVLSFNVMPGQHQLQVDYQRQIDSTWKTQLPAITLPLSAANIRLSLELPYDRWIVWTDGPLLGPVVLYWSVLLLFIVLAWGVARAQLTALNTRDLLLLGFGLSTVSWWVLTALVAWLALIYRHGKRDIRDDHAMTRFRYNVRQLFLFGFSGFAVMTLVTSVPAALLSSPDMMLVGNQSYGNQMHWFDDFSAGLLPNVTVISLPLWVYKGLMLLWAIWLSFALIAWLRSAWQALNLNEFWRGKIVTSSDEKIVTRE